MELVINDEVLSPSEAGRRAGVSTESIGYWCETDKLKFYGTPLGRLISGEDLERVIRERAARPAAIA
jgi:hypothetical protein